MGALAELLKRKGVAAQVVGEPPLFDVVFTSEPVRDYRGYPARRRRHAAALNARLRDRGILKGELKYYVSLAHTPDDVRHTVDAWASASKQLIVERQAQG